MWIENDEMKEEIKNLMIDKYVWCNKININIKKIVYLK